MAVSAIAAFGGGCSSAGDSDNLASAGFEQLDANLAKVHAANKKLVLFLNYKIFQNDQDVPNGAAPDYMMKSKSAWCVTADGTSECGQYQMQNGFTAMVWDPAVATRVRAWFTAVGNHGFNSRYRSDVAGYVLPETACSSDASFPLADFGCTQAKFVDAIEGISTRFVLQIRRTFRSST